MSPAIPTDPEAAPSPPPAPGPAMLRSGLVAVVGRANVGKSSLVNTLLGEKVSIVSPVAQTTRNLIRGILTEPRGQLVFLDTPGVHRARGSLGKIMNRTARSSVEGTDAVLLVVDASRPPAPEDRGWMTRLAREATPLIVALNKSDLPDAHADAYRAAWAEASAEAERAAPAWLPTSAATGAGLDRLLDTLFATVPEGPFWFPEDILSDYPRKLAIADVVREKLFGRLREDLPHAVAVWIDTLDEAEDGSWSVHGTVYVRKASQKGIVVGLKGRLLRAVCRAASRDLSEQFDRKVEVKLWVKVQPKWDENYWLLRQLGYVER